VVSLNVLLSINPDYAYKIFNGEKRYEFRRKIFKRNAINKMIIYATAPVCKILGYAYIEKIITDKKEEIWKKCFAYSGMEEKDFFTYFEGITIGFAIKMKNITKFEKPVDPYEIFINFNPPRSFYYLEEDFNIG
jgi:predicted transcriptional regulator